jgi:hypothetical protein
MCGSGDVIVGALLAVTVSPWFVLPPCSSGEVAASVFSAAGTLPVVVVAGVGVTGGTAGVFVGGGPVVGPYLLISLKIGRLQLYCPYLPHNSGAEAANLLGGKSTGPRTPEGLERSKRAHWKHGHFSREAKAERSRVRAAILAVRHLRDSI